MCALGGGILESWVGAGARETRSVGRQIMATWGGLWACEFPYTLSYEVYFGSTPNYREKVVDERADSDSEGPGDGSALADEVRSDAPEGDKPHHDQALGADDPREGQLSSASRERAEP